MKCLFGQCMFALLLITTYPVAAQNSSFPLQKGVSVKLPTTNNAVAVPDADRSDSLIVAVTYDGSVYFGTNLTNPTALIAQVKSAFSQRKEKTLYVKADARAPYASVIEVLDAVRAAGVEGVTLLTEQRESVKPGSLIHPKGLQLKVVGTDGASPATTRAN